MEILYLLIQKKFIEYSYDNNKKVVALQINRKIANFFSEKKFFVNYVGYETNIFIDKFDFNGKERAKLRRWINTAKNRGIEVEPLKSNNNDLSKVSEEWLKTKGDKELKLLVRKWEHKKELFTKIYGAFQNNELTAFVIYDPFFSAGKLKGYYADVIRYKPTAPNGSIDLINRKALEDFKKENIQLFSLGFSPLAGINDYNLNPYKSNNLTHLIFKINYNYGESLYPFKGIEFHKKAYFGKNQAINEDVFYASKSYFDILNIIEFFQEINILPEGSKTKALLYSTFNLAKGGLRK